MSLTIFHFSAWLFFLGLGFSAFYVFPSGNPQPTDFLLALASMMLILTNIKHLCGWRVLWPMVALTVWVAAVSIGWSAVYPSGLFYRPPLFYAFNCLFMFAVVNLFYYLDRPVHVFAAVVQLALVISGVGVFLSFLMPDILIATESLRITGFFNNPNQLAYYNLCMLATLLILKGGQLTNRPFGLLAVASGIIGILAASSLGAMAGLFFIVMAIIVGNWNSAGKLLKVVWGGILLVSLVGVFDLYTGGGVVDRVDTRLGSLERKMDQLESERKYDRILAYPEYWWVGAAEGSTERFPGYEGGEIHSSFGNMLFAYGFVGLGLFLLLLWRAVRFAPLYAWLCLAAPLTYSLTHMGLRNTAFWFLIVVMLVYFRYSRAPSRVSSRQRMRQSIGTTASPLGRLGNRGSQVDPVRSRFR